MDAEGVVDEFRFLPKAYVAKGSHSSSEIIRACAVGSREGILSFLSWLRNLLESVSEECFPLFSELLLWFANVYCMSCILFDPQHGHTNEFLYAHSGAETNVIAKFGRMTLAWFTNVTPERKVSS